MTYQNAVSAKNQNKVNLAKIAGLLSKSQNVEYLYRVCLYLDILEKVSPLSLVFEGENLLPCEIRPNLRLAIEELAEIKDSRENEAIEPDSNMRFFYMVTDEKEEGQFMLTREYQKAGHELRKEKNKGFRTVQIGGMKMNNGKFEVSQPAADVASKLIDLLEYRFNYFKDDIYQHMKWLDPQYWDADDRLYGNIQITSLSSHFEEVLARKSFDLKKALVEWKSFKIFAFEMFQSNISPFSLWRSVISSRRNEYPFLEKRRVKTTGLFEEPPPKIQKLDSNNCSESDEQSSEADDLDAYTEEELAD